MKSLSCVIFSLCMTVVSDEMIEPNPIESIVRAVIDSKELEQYYHVGTVSGRAPLILVSDDIPSSVKLEKFGLPVVVCSSDIANRVKVAANLEVTIINIGSNSANVMLKYLVEGVVGKMQLQRTDGKWKIANSDIKEY